MFVETNQHSHLNIGAPLSKISGKAVEKLTDDSRLNFFTDDPGEDQHHNDDADHEYEGDDDDGNDDDNDDDVDDDLYIIGAVCHKSHYFCIQRI